MNFPTISTVRLQGNLVLDVKAGQPLRSKTLYTIQVLHCLQRCIGVPRLFRIVTSASRQELKSYLVETLLKHSIFVYTHADYCVLPWHRRENGHGKSSKL